MVSYRLHSTGDRTSLVTKEGIQGRGAEGHREKKGGHRLVRVCEGFYRIGSIARRGQG